MESLPFTGEVDCWAFKAFKLRVKWTSQRSIVVIPDLLGCHPGNVKNIILPETNSKFAPENEWDWKVYLPDLGREKAHFKGLFLSC